MRYQVVVQLPGATRPTTHFVEAQTFHNTGEAAAAFTTMRSLANGLNDNWGNPARSPQRVTVAMFTNVISVQEVQEEFAQEPETPFVGATGGIRQAPEWITDHVGNMGRGATRAVLPDIAPPRLDDDGVNWDAERIER
jgi:hypothetical protein